MSPGGRGSTCHSRSDWRGVGRRTGLAPYLEAVGYDPGEQTQAPTSRSLGFIEGISKTNERGHRDLE